MFLAVLADARRSSALEVAAIVDDSLPVDVPAGVVRRTTPPGGELETLAAAAASADVTLVVAPETDGILARRLAVVRTAGGRPLACDPAFIALAADKQATALALAAAGMPVPAGRSLEPHAAWPMHFIRPAIRKRRDGVGGAGLLIVDRGMPPPAAAGYATRIEALVPGLAVGVSLMCGAGKPRVVAVLEQVFDPAAPGSYRGGRGIVDAGRRSRAARLATRAVAAVARASGGTAHGWVGVDMILGDREDGGADRILEVNPRLTSAFVGIARRSPASLVAAMIQPASLPWPDPLAVDGLTSILDFRIDIDG